MRAAYPGRAGLCVGLCALGQRAGQRPIAIWSVGQGAQQQGDLGDTPVGVRDLDEDAVEVLASEWPLMNVTVSTWRVAVTSSRTLPIESEHVHHLIAAAVGGRRAVEDDVVGNERRKRLAIALPDRAQQSPCAHYPR